MSNRTVKKRLTVGKSRTKRPSYGPCNTDCIRLDWLEKNRLTVFFEEGWECWIGGTGYKKFKTLRAAVDSAMMAERNPK